MKTTIRYLGLVLVVAFLVTLGAVVAVSATPEAPQRQAPIIIDHTCTDLSQVPDTWIERAKEQLRLSYGHTSHGSQPVTGMKILMADPASGGLYDFNTNGAVVSDTLSLADYTPSGDLGNPDRVTWATRTRDYLNGPGSDRNVVVWSWCGQVNDATEEDIETYLSLMSELEEDFPQVTFVYMTGHLEGTGVDENLYARNNQIRDYCVANNKVLFDFADIESWDPDGNYYPDEDDGCGWCSDWCATHACPTCPEDCAHSHCFNCYQKGQAFWWMLARIAGWDGGLGSGPTKSASTQNVTFGDTVTYTVVIRDLAAPPTATVVLTDELPAGLSYVSGTIAATAGTVTDTAAPLLGWSGVLSPTPVVTVTYAVTVDTAVPQLVTNSAVIAVPGYDTVTRTAVLSVSFPYTQPNLSPSYKAASVLYADYGERFTYTVVIQNAAGPMTNTAYFTDVVPDGLLYVSGTLTATTGTVSDTEAPTLTWTGILSPVPEVHIVYEVEVVTTETMPVVNQATFLMETRSFGEVIIVPPVYVRKARVLLNSHRLYVPLVFKSWG